MIVRGSQTIKKNPFRDAANRDRDFLLALARAAQAIQRAHIAEDFYKAVGMEFKSLGCETTLMLVNEDRQSLSIVYTSYARALVQKAEKLTGLRINHPLPFSLDTIYGRILANGTSEYIESATEAITEIIPAQLHIFIPPLLAMFKLRQGILAPLHVDGNVLGLLKVTGGFLIERDLPAIESFAGQIAAGLQNLKLMKKLQDELEARKQAEEALRSSEAKVRALLGAVPDILFVLTRTGEYVDCYTSHFDELFVSPAEFLGRNVRDVMPAEIADLYFTALDHLLQTGESQLFEYSLTLPDGLHEFEAHLDRYQGEYILCVARDVTERKRSEIAVRQAEKRFKAMIENAPDGIAMVGMDGRIKYASPSARNMFGYTREDYTRGNALEFIHPDDLGTVVGALAGLIENPSLIPTIQYRYMHKDGSYHWVESTFSNQLYEPGVEAVVINFRDVTERRLMEKAIHESEKYHRALIENAADGIIVINTEARISYESPSVANLLGYGKSGLMWRNAFELIHPDDLPRILEVFKNGLTEPGLNHRGEYRLLHANGKWRIFEIVSHYLMNDPAIMGIIINGRDITERKSAEEALRESERRFHSIVSESSDGINLIDEDGLVIEINSAMEEITGLKRKDVIGMYAWDFLIQLVPEHLRTVEMSQRIKTDFHQMLETGQNPYPRHLVEVPIERADGSQRFIQLRKFSIRTEKGWRLGSMARDVTERVQAEQALRQQFTNLRSLYQMTATLGQSTELEAIFNTALDSLQNTLSADRAAILLFDPDGVVRFKSWRGLSEAYRKLVEGHSPWKQNEINPQPVLVPDVFVDAGLSHLSSAFAIEKIGSLAFIPLVHLGRLLGKFMIYFNTPHLFGEGEIQLAQTIARHVAFAISRQQAETALRTSEERHRFLYEDNPSMYFTTDENGLILSANRYGIKHLGFANEDLTGTSLFNIFHPEDREFVRRQLASCVQDMERTAQMEVRKLHKDGSVLWVREFARAVRDTTDDRLVILIVCNDLTEEINAREALARSEAELRALFSSMKDTVLVIDRNGVYQSVAPTTPELYYIPPEEVVGNTLPAFFPEDKVKEFLKAIEEVLLTGNTVHLEYEIVLDGQAPWFEAAVSPLGPDTTIWVTRDITARKRTEDDLRRANISLQEAQKELQQLFEHEQVLARTDVLTHLYNRRYFFELAVREFSAAVRYQRSLTLILFDVDGFKTANDTFGHGLGDTILTRISHTAKLQVREVDILARYGGDEFTVLLPETNAEQAMLIAERIRTSVETIDIECGETTISVTVSLGVAEIDLEQDQSIEDVIRRADQALYKAKQSGRNHAVSFGAN